MSRRKAKPIVDIDVKEIESLLDRIKTLISPEDVACLKGLVATLLVVTKLLRERATTIARLRRLFGFSSSEKLADQVGSGESAKPPEGAPAPGDTAAAGDAPHQAGDEPNAGVGSDVAGTAGTGKESKPADDSAEPPKKKRKKVKGHGRVPASAYRAAEVIPVPHETLHAGCGCPDCGHGTVYQIKELAYIVRISGKAPLCAKRWDQEQWRCGACGKVFTARAPEEAQGEKYDETAASMMAILRYRAGVPLNCLDHLQRDLETPVPASTQWEVVKDRVELVRPVRDELIRIAAQGSVLHNDDSYVRILEFMGKRRAELVRTKSKELPDPERTGLFTTAIVSTAETRPTIALFFTGRKHAGENLADVLDKRDVHLPPPILMGDALTRNVPEGHAVIESNCIAHGRRKIVDEIENYPPECRYVLERLGLVYKVDDLCRDKKLSAKERLEWHQRESGPLMEEIRQWMTEQLAEKRVEPNSGLGEAINYLLKRWEKFTLFLRVAGAPLDNNICERALKMAIKHRNASLFYRTQKGAEVGDIYMTLIHTTELCGGNPFDYLTALQRHHKAVADKPSEWLPWNYRDTLARSGLKETRGRGSGGSPATTSSVTPPLAA